MKLILILLLFLMSCGSVEKKEPTKSYDKAKIEKINSILKDLHSRANAIAKSNPWNGAIQNSGDSMLYEGKYRATKGAKLLDVNVFRLSKEKGRYYRRATSPCISDDGSNEVCSKTTWSRDMDLGFLYWMFRTGNKQALNDHYEYGKKNLWQMGKPFNDGRVQLHTNSLFDLAIVREAVTGIKSIYRNWLPVYFKGHTGYQAHLDVLSIALEGEVYEMLNFRKSRITKNMLAILREHAEREPLNPLYQAVYGKYTGDMSKAINTCIADYPPYPISRCFEDEIGCKISEQAFACDFTLRTLGVKL